MVQRKKVARRAPKAFTQQFVLNCNPSVSTDNDWTFEDSVSSGVSHLSRAIPGRKDLRAPWWKVEHQGNTGACVGYSTAYGILRWHYVHAGWIRRTQKPSARFIWMANKETDGITSYPTTFLESAGTQTKLALNVARKYGCVLEADLPIKGGLSTMTSAASYAKAARFRIASYHNLGRDLDTWRRWIAHQGPILTRLNVDAAWDNAASTNGHLKRYRPGTARGGHAVCIVGYTPQYFIVRNSWGARWGDEGFAYAWDAYAANAFTEAYGAVL